MSSPRPDLSTCESNPELESAYGPWPLSADLPTATRIPGRIPILLRQTVAGGREEPRESFHHHQNPERLRSSRPEAAPGQCRSCRLLAPPASRQLIRSL